MKNGATAKLKAHLAMAAFVIVATAMVVLTAVGALSHATLSVEAEGTSQQANDARTPVGVAATSTGAFNFSEK